MKTNQMGMLLLPAPAKRAKRINWHLVRAEIIKFYNRYVPEEFKIKTKSDAFNSLSVYTLAISLIIPYVIPAFAWCVYKAKRGGNK
jgi:hypothetical protein